jgi:hypothetical protein
MALLAADGDAARHRPDAVDIGDGGAAELLYQKGHPRGRRGSER